MRTPLDMHDILPDGMRAYISHYGFNFNKKAFDEAVRTMKRINPSSGRLEKVTPTPKDKVADILASHGIALEHDTLYNAAYVYNMGMADYYGSSIPDEGFLARYVKDVLDDPDGSEELPFRFWLQKRVALGLPIEWDDLI